MNKQPLHAKLTYCNDSTVVSLFQSINTLIDNRKDVDLVNSIASINSIQTSYNTVHYSIIFSKMDTHSEVIMNNKGKVLYCIYGPDTIIPPNLKFDRRKFNELIFNLNNLKKG